MWLFVGGRSFELQKRWPVIQSSVAFKSIDQESLASDAGWIGPIMTDDVE